MAYTKGQVDSSVRKSNAPSRLISYLPIGSPFSTGALTPATWTKVLVTTTPKSLNDFAIVDTGGGDLRYQYQGDETRTFRVGMTTGASASVNSTTIEFAMSNGTIGVDQDTLEDGVYIKALAKTSGDISPMGLEGYFTMEPLDTIAVWVKTDTAANITFDGMSIVIIEVN